MDDDFRILFDYVEQMKRELQDEADLQSKSAEDEEKKCVHESIETEEAYVCCKCGLVLEDIFQPDIHWCDHALMPRIYGGADRLNAMLGVKGMFERSISFGCEAKVRTRGSPHQTFERSRMHVDRSKVKERSVFKCKSDPCRTLARPADTAVGVTGSQRNRTFERATLSQRSLFSWQQEDSCRTTMW